MTTKCVQSKSGAMSDRMAKVLHYKRRYIGRRPNNMKEKNLRVDTSKVTPPEVTRVWRVFCIIFMLCCHQ